MGIAFPSFKYSARMMRRDAFVTISAVFILALGIGSTSVAFSLVNGLLLRPLPYSDPERIVAVQESESRKGGIVCCEVGFRDYSSIRDSTRLLDSIALYNERLATIRGDGIAERVPAANASDGLFHVLSAMPILGQTYTREEDQPNGSNVVVIGEDLWRERFGADPKIIGRILDIGGAKNRVIGVMPSGFRFPDRALAWFPLRLSVNDVGPDQFFDGIARLKPGVSIVQANAELQSIMLRLKSISGASSVSSAQIVPIRQVLAATYRSEVLMLLGAVCFLLLIACANVSNLILVKSTGRSREMAIRLALGSSRARLIRQLMMENLPLGLIGGLAGLAFTYAGLPLLLRLVPIDLPQWLHFSVDLRVLLFIVGISVLGSILFGIAPAFTASRVDSATSLRDFSTTSRPHERRVLNGMIVGQISLTVALLIGAVLLMRSFIALRNQPLGFDSTRVLTMYLSVPPERYPAGPESRALLQKIHQEFSALPGVSTVAFASGIPFETASSSRLTVEGFSALTPGDTPVINYTVITPGYLKALSIPVLKGRDFASTDYENPLAAIIDVNLARTYWPHESALGKHIRLGRSENSGSWYTVVGVVDPVVNQSLTGPRKWGVYLPFNEHSGAGMSVVIRTAVNPAQLASVVRARINSLDPNIVLTALYTLDQVVDLTVWKQRFFTMLFAVFSSLSTVLVLTGFYAGLSYAVSHRTNEIGIRMALGASSGRLQGMILRQGLVIVGIGLALGLVLAFFFGRMLASQLYHISTLDPWTYAIVCGGFFLVSLAACWVPARRTIRVDPIVALRHN